MIKISSKSWHYRLLDKLGVNPRSKITLCDYFWSLIASFIGIAILLLMVFILSFPILQFFIDTKGYEIFGAIMDIVILLCIWVYHRENHPYYKAKTLENTKSTNIFIEYLRAIKYKVCPFIEFTD